ncbi:MAG: hypothetical protein HYX54_03810 [Chloroflexi bacterium]|nr:hypothetical protein [Chloroflexota bacterium]
MAKRTRYPGRPPGHRPAVRPTPNGPVTVRSNGLTEAEVQRAAEIESELVAREREAISENARRRARARGVDAAVASDSGAPLSVRAAHEYAYVARDVRRIGLTAAIMFGILAVLWLIVNVGGVAIF